MSHQPTIPWIAEAAGEIAVRAERELDALVGASSPSGDVAGLEEAAAIVTALLPAEAVVERPECSTPGHAPDLLARVKGSGEGRVLLLGHLDTVVPHAEHRPLERAGGRLVGSGAVDMKGGVVLGLGVLRALAALPRAFSELVLLAVADEEWRTHRFVHGERFAGFDACLCFEVGERDPRGDEGVVVRRKAAATLLVRATGASAHSGTAPDRGRNALLAISAAAERVAAAHDPHGADRLTAVPTIMRSGEAFNVVPSLGELWCDLRADSVDAFQPVLEALPESAYGASLDAEFIRYWPGMDTHQASASLLEAAATLLGRPVVGVERGGASDASHMAAHVPLTVDGLGPRGGGAHTPEEFVDRESLPQRAEVALAVAAAVLGMGEPDEVHPRARPAVATPSRGDGDARVADLESAEIAAYADLWEAAPEPLAFEQGIAQAEVDGVHCTCVAGLPGVRIVNHALGLSVEQPPDEATLDRIEAFFSDRGLPTLIAVREGATVEGQLRARGYEGDYAWVKFERDASPAAAGESDLDVRAAATTDAARVGELLTSGFELPADLSPWFTALVGRPGWHCLGAYDGQELVGTGSLFVAGDRGYLGFAATDPAHRGRRAQKALLAARIAIGHELGLRLLVTETGDVEAGRPDASHRNIRGAGFQPVYRRPFWRSPA